MARLKGSTKKVEVNPEYVRLYYEHQYNRIDKHTDQALNISNIVITISTVIITFGFNNQQTVQTIFVLFLPLIIVMVNIFALLYLRDSSRWIDSHRLRAKKLLEKYMPELYELDNEAVPHHFSKIGNSSDRYRGKISRRIVQMFIHIIFTLIGVALFVLFLLGILHVAI